jgi:Pyrroline-5-carboxylate reductase
MKNILFFGGGNIAQALISGLLLNGMSNKNIFFVDRNPLNQKKFKQVKS